MESLAEVLMEAGIDLPGLASARAGGGAPGGSSPATLGSAGGPGMAGAAPAAAPASGGLWTPGGSPAAPQQGEKKTIWTPGS
jgi:hypothetical protein